MPDLRALNLAPETAVQHSACFAHSEIIRPLDVLCRTSLTSLAQTCICIFSAEDRSC